MTMPRKNRRNLIVDGVKYHWIERGHGKEHWLNLGYSSGCITFQEAPGRGACLFLVFIEYPTRRDLAEVIRFALQHGWQPSQNKPFYLGFSDAPARERFVVRTKDSEPLDPGFEETEDPKQRLNVHFKPQAMFEALPTRLAKGTLRFAVGEYLGPPEKHDEQRDLFLLVYQLLACRVLLVTYNTDDLVNDYRVMRVALEDYQQFPNPLVELPLPPGWRLPNATP
jgi:hypothetical protein